MNIEDMPELTEEELFQKIVKKLENTWFNDPNKNFVFKEDINGDIVIFVSNSEKYVVVDTENNVQV